MFGGMKKQFIGTTTYSGGPISLLSIPFAPFAFDCANTLTIGYFL